jgi:hypothetical protein
MISKRNKEILAEKEKLSRQQNDFEALKTKVDPEYITTRHDELKRLATERGKYECQRKEVEFLRNMQNDVDESMLSAARARFDIPTAEENQEFEFKIAQEQENIQNYRKMVQVREKIKPIEGEKNDLIFANQQQGLNVYNEVTIQNTNRIQAIEQRLQEVNAALYNLMH